MPVRTTPLVNDEYYHIINRGVARIPIFLTPRDYQRFTNTFIYYLNTTPTTRYSFSNNKHIPEPQNQIVDVISYCLMPNHFHFLLKQNKEDGIRTFVRKISNSYAKYFNIKNERKGPLFEGVFKAVRIETNEQLLHVSRYIHLNPSVSYVVKDLNSYPWSSYHEFLGSSKLQICSKDIVLNQFKSQKHYEQFVLDHENYGKKLEYIKHLLLEND